ncbi:MAG TPA: methyltransferase [Polyangiaceae bacterium]
MSPAKQLRAVLAVALPAADILSGRLEDASVPAWCAQRDWADFLLGLDASMLRRCEAHGLGQVLPELAAAPRDLRQLADEVRQVIELPLLRVVSPLAGEALRSVKLRKRAQLEGLLAAVSGMAQEAERIVDVGAGSGHFTRLSAELFQREALGLERNPDRVAAAERRAGVGVRFEVADARQLALQESDLAIGLHACGELGDQLIATAGRARCDLALVSCCLQKISSDVRQPLSRAAAGAELRKEHLGLSNLTAQPRGVEVEIEVTLAARETRYALGSLLRERGVALEPGAEMSGINRRRANAGLADVAARALELRGLAPASAAELAHHTQLAAHDYARIRRLSLPRSMLARLVEVLVSLDRAAHLEEQGLQVLVATLFERAVSPRNIGIFASCSLSRLPAA